MKHSLLLIAALTSSVLSQDLGPSPTASVGCEPHGDHWHCDGPATDMTATPAVPSPTASVGCEPHGDHWHCDGPVSTDVMPTSTASHQEHEHEHDHGTATPTVPSPTASVGCEPHGDHWHCDGPVETSSTSGAASASSTESGEENSADMLGIRFSSVIGLAIGVAMLCM